jgi:hypothetical protein
METPAGQLQNGIRSLLSAGLVSFRHLLRAIQQLIAGRVVRSRGVQECLRRLRLILGEPD